MKDRFPFSRVPLHIHILRSVFKASVAELGLPEARWAEHAKAMVRERTHDAHVDSGMIDWIIRK